MSKIVINSHIGEVKELLNIQLPILMEALAIEAEGNAITEVNKLVYDAPESSSYVRTGRLKNSITHASDDSKAYVGTNLSYAPYVELGTSKMAPRPFLKNAILNYQDDYKRIIKKGLS